MDRANDFGSGDMTFNSLNGLSLELLHVDLGSSGLQDMSVTPRLVISSSSRELVPWLESSLETPKRPDSPKLCARIVTVNLDDRFLRLVAPPT